MKCPHCGKEIETRAKLGQGTRKAKYMKLNENRKILLKILKEHPEGLEIREIQKKLFDRKIRRESKRGAGWNYHTIQADLSNLLGGGYVSMERKGKEVFDKEDGHTTTKIPIYKFETDVPIQEREGLLKY